MSVQASPADLRRSARSRLFGRTALSGALGVFALAGAGGLHAAPMGASVPRGVTQAPTITTTGSDTQVKLNQTRTIIDWKSFDVAKGEQLDFLFNNANGIVLNRVNGVADINGALKGCVVTCSVIGGNVWIYASDGVIFGSHAQVSVGSLLATTTPIASASDFLAGGATNFTFQGGQALAKVSVDTGAQLAAHGGALALIAPQVETQAGSSLTAAGTALVAAAQNFVIHFDQSVGGDLDLIDFEVPASALKDGSVSATPLSVNGAVSGGSVVLAAVSRPSVMNAVISIGGVVTATSAKADQAGDIVLTGSGAASTLNVSGVLSASRSVSVQAPDGGAIDISGAVTARDATGQGGAIVIGGAGSAKAALESGGLLDATSAAPGTVGGRIDMTAHALDVEGAVAASGPAGGGTIRIGGGAHGQDSTLADADTLTVGATATIDASATSSGDGGSVTLWSNTATSFAGSILSRGGPLGGQGGGAEVSGGHLDFAGGVDLRGPAGATGTLLLDPTDIAVTRDSTVDTTEFGAPTPPPPAVGTATSAAGVSTVTVGTINQVLKSANVDVATDGQITFVDKTGVGATPPDYTFADVGGGAQLTFTAGKGFTFKALPIEGTGGLSLTFDAQANALTTGAAISTTGGGGITLKGTSITIANALDAGIGATGGAVTLAASAGGVSETAGGSIHAGLLSVTATAPALAAAAVSLAQTGNDVTQFTAAVSGATLVAPATTTTSLASDITLADGASTLTVAAGGIKTFSGDISLTDDNTAHTLGALTITGGVSTGAGGISLDASSIALGGVIDAGTGPTGGTVSLTATAGGVSQTTGDIHAGLLSVATTAPALGGGTISLTPTTTANDVTQFTASVVKTDATSKASNITLSDGAASLTVPSTGVQTFLGNVSLTNDNTAHSLGSLTLAGGVTAAGTLLNGGVSLTAGGVISENGGIVTATTLAVTGHAAITLDGANQVGALTGLTNSSTAATSFEETPALSVAGPITVGGDLTLQSGGALTSTEATGPSVGGNYAVTASSFGAAPAPLLAPTLTGTASGFSITQTAGDFDLAAVGVHTVPGAFSVTTPGVITDTGTAVISAASISLTGTSVTPGGLTATGPTGAITLDATTGSISQTGILTAAFLSATAGGAAKTASNTITLTNANNDVTTLSVLAGDGTLTAPATGVSFTDAHASALVVQGASAGAGALNITNSDGLTITGALAGGTVGLTATAGDVNFTQAYALAAPTTVNAPHGSVTFDAAVNGGFALTTTTGPAAPTVFEAAVGSGPGDALASLTTSGATTAQGDITTTGSISLGGTLTLSPTTGSLVTLTSTGANVGITSAQSDATARSLYVDAASGGFTATGAIGTSASPLAGFGLKAQTASLQTGNDVSTVAIDLLAAGALTFDNGANALAVGTVGGVTGVTTNASDATLAAASLALTADVNVGTANALTLTATGGNINQTGGIVTADTLSASSVAPSGASGFISLSSPNNSVAQFSASATATDATSTQSDITLADAASSLTIAAAGVKTFWGNISLSAGSEDVQGPVTATPHAGVGGGVGLGAGGTISIGAPVGGSSISLQGSSLLLGGALDAGGGPVSLTATAGGVSQTVSGITAGLLTVSTAAPASQAASILLTKTNKVAQFTATVTGAAPVAPATATSSLQSNIILADAATSLSTVSSVKTFFGDVSLTNDNAGHTVGALAIGGTVTATVGPGAGDGGGGITLTAGGAITESGTLVADTLAVNGQAAITLDGANQVGTLTELANGSSTAAISFFDTPMLSVATTITAGGDLTLKSGSALTSTEATGPSVGGNYAVTASSFGAAPAPLLAPTLTGTASGFSITQTAGDFDLAAVGVHTVPGAFSVTTPGVITDTGTAVISAASISLTGTSVTPGGLTATGPTGAITLDATTGSISQTGILTAAFLSATAGGAAKTASNTITLTNANNDVTTLSVLAGDGTLTAPATGVSFTDAHASALVVQGASAGAGALNITNSDGLTITGALAGGTVGLTATAGDVNFTQAYALAAPTTVNAPHGSVTFDAAVNGGFALTTTTGPAAPTVFEAAVGSGPGDALASLTTSGATTAQGDITTTGSISLGGTLTLSPTTGSLVTLTSTGANVGITSAQSDATARSLYVDAASGGFTATGAIGTSASPLAGFGLKAQTASLQTGNDVSTVAIDLLAAGALTFDNGANALAVGTVGGVTGVTTNASDATLAAASLALTADVNVGTANALTLTATGGNINQTGGIVTADTLSASSVAPSGASGFISLSSPNNSVAQFSASATATDATSTQSDITLADAASSLTIPAAGVKTFLGDISLTNDNAGHTLGALITTGDVSTPKGGVTLDASSLALGGGVDAGTGAAGGAVTLTATAGGVSQTGGDIHAGLLDVSATAPAAAAAAISLAQAGNDVTQFTASVGGTDATSLQSDVTLVDAAASLSTATRVKTFFGDISLTNDNPGHTLGPLAIGGTVTATAGPAAGDGGGGVTLTAGGAITETGTLVATTLAVTGHAAIALNGANQVGALTGLSGAAGASFSNDTTAFKVVSANGGAGELSLSNTGR